MNFLSNRVHPFPNYRLPQGDRRQRAVSRRRTSRWPLEQDPVRGVPLTKGIVARVTLLMTSPARPLAEHDRHGVQPPWPSTDFSQRQMDLEVPAMGYSPCRLSNV